MLKLIKATLLVFVLCCLQPLYADEARSPQPSQESGVVEKKAADGDEGMSGVTIALLVFIGAILFVISSATAMNALGGKPPGSGGSTPPTRRKKVVDARDRFRL